MPNKHSLRKLLILKDNVTFKIYYCTLGIHKIESSNMHALKNSEREISYKLEFIEDIKFKHLTYLIEWFRSYFTKGYARQYPNEYICWQEFKNCKFYINTWKTLMNFVNYGETISYSGLAKIMSQPRASRAVGNAMNKNPLVLIVPCHRVIKNNGQIGNYSCGNAIKKWLLLKEMLRQDLNFDSLSKFNYTRK